MAIPAGPSEAPIRAASTMRGTIGSFFGVLGQVALPVFIYFKNKNEVKKREQYQQSRVRGGALAQSMEGTKA
ncbi:uncharacterized protein JCM6883_004121 [Sporobolomyces salmoneus]|uniref:uncharacterized protein n=1 Tax=Sporobolomyces salmoneus TaxID=183962 RepID=UPI0031772012